MIKDLFFPTLSDSKSGFYILAFGLFFGILIRILMIYFFIDHDFLHGDAASYIKTARNIVDFGVFGLEQEATVYRPPMYSYFVALIMFIFGNEIVNVQILQIFVGLISGILITRISAIFFPNSSVWIFFLFMLSPFEAVYSVTLLSESLTSLFLVLTAFFLLTFNNLKGWVFGGISLGLCCLTRDIYLLLGFLIVLIWLVFGSDNLKLKFKYSMVFLFSMFFIISPWTIRNYYQTDSFVPISKGRIGYDLWLGTWVKNGEYTKAFIKKTPIFPPEAPLTKNDKLFLEKALEGDPSSPIINDRMLELALERIKKEPLEVFKSYLIRSPKLWLGTRFDVFVINKKWFPRESASWHLIKVSLYGLNFCLMVLGLLGIIFVWRKKNPLIFLTLPIFYSALIYMPFSSFENRYSQPVYPFVLIFAAVSISIIINQVNLKRH